MSKFSIRKSLNIGLFIFACILGMHKNANASRNVINLSGAWGLSTGEKMPSSFKSKVQVPGLVDIAEPNLNWKNEKYFWYKKTFKVKNPGPGKHVFIKIGQSQFGTEVYLNNKKLGSYIGCYTSHEYMADNAVKYDALNTLLIRVGAKDTLPEESAIGHDRERVHWIPGIWGDVGVYITGSSRIENIQVIPVIETKSAVINVNVENIGNKAKGIKAAASIFEKKSGKKIGENNVMIKVEPNTQKAAATEVKIEDMNLWSPDAPFLYTAKVKLYEDDIETDSLNANFGMRKFEIKGKHFFLNGERIVLMGSNIAFHRFLADPERKGLVWNEAWIKKCLIDIPKTHNFNYFRNHLGQMYNKWYDIADEYGIMLRDEWNFWSVPSGSKEQIRKEFTQWLKDNWNHPSIIMWDSQNEPTYGHPDRLPLINWVKENLISEMKALDPTRPWEPTDFEEIHPYIYSMHSVLGLRSSGGLGYIDKIEKSKNPVSLNEYIYFWIDKDGGISDLTKDVIVRWLGKDSIPEERLSFQAFLAQELTELFRRMDADELAPFAYLSTNEGATSHWFMGDIKDLNPKPILAALKNAFSPFGISIELWDRHFYCNEERKAKVYIFNDSNEDKKGRVVTNIVNESGSETYTLDSVEISIKKNSREIIDVSIKMPKNTGTYYLLSELYEDTKAETVSFSKKVMHVFNEPKDLDLKDTKIMVLEEDNEISKFLKEKKIKALKFNAKSLNKCDMLILGPGVLLDKAYTKEINRVTEFVKSGKCVIVSEIASGIKLKTEIDVLEEVSFTVNPIEWRGGESYVFAEDIRFPLWENLKEGHLKMFNGGWGGEIVSGCDVTGPLPFNIKARCGLGLKTPAVIETNSGKGLLVVSRIGLSGRLGNLKDNPKGLYDKKSDPVAKQYLLNLIKTYIPGTGLFNAIVNGLASRETKIKKADASSTEGSNNAISAIDKNPSTRWSSAFNDPEWISFDLGKISTVYGVKIFWETACASEYEISVSADGKNWQKVFYTLSGNGGSDYIVLSEPKEARYVKMNGLKRATDWGYSIREFEIFTEKAELPNEVPLKCDKPLEPINVKAVLISSKESNETKGENAVDGDLKTRWSSLFNDNEWILFDLGDEKKISKVTVLWENACAKEYKLQVSNDGDTWTDVYHNKSGKPGPEEIDLKSKDLKSRYLRIQCIKRAANFGYSIFDVKIY